MSLLPNPGATLDPIAALIKNPFNTKVTSQIRPDDFPGGFQIIEFVNGKPDQTTQLRFTGNLMPMVPFEWSGEQRIITNYYPGNAEPNKQLLGPKEGDILIRGRFKDKRYKDPSYYGVSYVYARAVDAMRKRGNLVKFGMHGMAGDFFRYGYIEKSAFKMSKLSWIDYEITFSVIGETQPKYNYFAATEKQAPDNINNALLNSASAFNQNYSSIPKTMPQSLAGLLNGLISDVAKNINAVTGFVGTIISTGQDVIQSANRAIGLVKNARANLSIFRRQIGGISTAFNKITSQGVNSNAAVFAAAYKNIVYLHSMSAAAQDMASLLAKMQAQFEALSRTLPLARYKVLPQDSLQKISVKYYGSADNWQLIMQHNQLQSTVLTQGQILEIPKA